MIKSGITIGLISGSVLGLFLKWIETITGKKVYTLLLNIDFIPVIGAVTWPESIEFFFHLLIAFIIGILFVYAAKKFTTQSWKWLLVISTILTLPTIPLYFPLTILAIKETPALNDFMAILYWTIGHLLFALTLAYSYYFMQKRSSHK
ncbi:hypothetical protein [Metabacillus iocasae]|uniref:Phosphoglycerol transferase MdoB-like AlkP superfamily enzyme n=1 Tax=Priestia iocasae TaxID=2291674 RepID=A0ABS2QV51_9BACI|nr:hypothetical protein [Metabacillus iocasae]MBM7703365.1 phosphoglycerol transferase MdoB-like AlkP superfamily enzyme [Metabacillus iocasae]